MIKQANKDGNEKVARIRRDSELQSGSQELRRFVPSTLCKVSDGALRLGANVTSGRCDVITRGICWLTFYRVRLRHERLGYRFSSICFVLDL